jgi:hypothetical protein
MLSSVEKVVLRLLFRQANNLKVRNLPFLYLQPFPTKREFQDTSTYNTEEGLNNSLVTLFPSELHDSIKKNINSRVVSTEDFRKCIKSCYRMTKEKEEHRQTNHNLGISSLRSINQLVKHFYLICSTQFIPL